MRDIRNDLQERANLIEKEITAAIAHFENQVEALRREYDSRVAELKAETAVLGVLMESEHQRMPSDTRPIEPEYQRMPNASRPIESELHHIGDRLRQLQDGRPAAPSIRRQVV
jgi:hypothetical protein